GFKQYNDNFGHPAGDSLLERLGARLQDAMDGIGRAYRMGGDEFCILAPVAEGAANTIAELAADALSEEGAGFAVRCSFGTAVLLGLPGEEIERIRLAAELHDIGKTAVPDQILSKPGALNDQEWEFIRRHTLIGERIVRAAPALASAADLVRSHRERLDGS